MKISALTLGLALALTTGGTRATDLRVWAAPTDAGLVRAWAEAFEKISPATRVVPTFHGPESAMMGVYTGVAELALMARELRQPAEMMAFTWAWRYPPTMVEVANAGADTVRPHASLAVFVHEKNPLTQLTLAQLDAIFGAEHKRGTENIRTWGQLGLTGEWAGKPIHVLGPAIDSVPALFFRHAMLADSYKWNAALAEFADDTALLAALARDESAIAYAPAHAAPAGVKVLALAVKDEAPPLALTPENVIARTYPLARVVTFVLNRAPGAPVAAATREFLRFVLSPEGQAIIAREGSCLPLSPATAQAEWKKIE